MGELYKTICVVMVGCIVLASLRYDLVISGEKSPQEIKFELSLMSPKNEETHQDRQVTDEQ